MIRMVIGSENPQVAYGGLVEVVDAAEYPHTSERHPELRGHLRLADLVVLNKADRVTAAQLSALRADLAETVGQVPVYPTTNGRIDPGLLFDPPARPYVAEQLSLDDLMREHLHDHDDHHAHLHDGYDSVAFASDAPLDPRPLIALSRTRRPGCSEPRDSCPSRSPTTIASSCCIWSGAIWSCSRAGPRRANPAAPSWFSSARAWTPKRCSHGCARWCTRTWPTSTRTRCSARTATSRSTSRTPHDQ